MCQMVLQAQWGGDSWGQLTKQSMACSFLTLLLHKHGDGRGPSCPEQAAAMILINLSENKVK